MREIFVTELIKEVLGPRGGIHEIIDESPVSEYITGVLAPIVERGQLPSEIDNEAQIPVEDTQTYAEEADDIEVNTPPIFYPALDPKSKPSTMGLSFVIESKEIPKIDVCLTWARYDQFAIGNEKVAKYKWKRNPRCSGVFSPEIKSAIFWFDNQGKQTNDLTKAEISFHVIVNVKEKNQRFVQMYLVNQITPKDGKLITAQDHIFQPQIRISCCAGTKLVSGTRKTPEVKEEQELEFLYRGRPFYARGHLCSAIWKSIDPENSPDSSIKLDFSECLNDVPFTWLDGELVSDLERKRFSPPDLRTEFVPMYSIPYPELDFPEGYSLKPVLSAFELAEKWDIEELHLALSPLIQGYEKWIGLLEKQANSLPLSQNTIAQKMISECRTVCERIKTGIDILCKDTDARLAFCFANKAVGTQWKWTKKSEFIWRPFQLAFILLTLESIVNKHSRYRATCDLLWVPTGAGKTEAYLAIAAFTISYRRRKSLKGEISEATGAGVSIITRYTLRLLTIQQFRRTLSIISACESLRVYNFLQKDDPVGWRPEKCNIRNNFLWGSTPFSAGLWVGGSVSPNRLWDTWGGTEYIPGALNILKGKEGEGEPAQVLNCPACNSILAIPEMGLQVGDYDINLIVKISNEVLLRRLLPALVGKTFRSITLTQPVSVYSHGSKGYYTLTCHIRVANILGAKDIDDFWCHISTVLRNGGCDSKLMSARGSRPGYFLRQYVSRGTKDYDFEVFCPNPICPLHRPWCGGSPTGWVSGRDPSNFASSPDGVSIPLFPDANRLVDVQEPFLQGANLYISDRIPIPALTVEEQVYRRLPTIVVATVDKFARPPFEPKAAALFGNVQYHHRVFGYYRQHQPVSQHKDANGHPSPSGSSQAKLYQKLSHSMQNVDLILQDELHLVEGPLGSLVGVFETAIDFLAEEGKDYRVKYIASTATIRRAEEQIQSIFLRQLQLFPPHGLDADDRYFTRERELHSLDDKTRGRLYIGICAPGRGPLTPIVRIYSRILESVWQRRKHTATNSYWTLTGYFNAIRELAGARALYRQDIPQRINGISSGDPRPISDERGRVEELSSRTKSTDLPAILDMLNRSYPDSPDVLFTTSMFGTGVDIPRIGLMVVNGQPKTTSAYIQSTGRVGRSRGAIVVTFLRASRPRDLNHYEFFVGYHRQLHRFVEPATVYPFSIGVLERALGPVSVFILRNMRQATIDWYRDDTAPLMSNNRTKNAEVQHLLQIFANRAQQQPSYRKPPQTALMRIIGSKLDAWQMVGTNRPNLKYVEYAINGPPQFPVVLGDYQHEHARLDVVYENAPRSLRDIEESTGFQVK